MLNPQVDRRAVIRATCATGGAIVMGANSRATADDKARRLRVVCVGGHPDDPESGCAGTLALYAQSGHQVRIVYLTRGERGIQGISDDEAAAIRTAECESACKILGAKPLFPGQIDGSTV